MADLFDGQYGTGALPLPEDWRDREIARMPGVREILEVGAPPTADLSHLFKAIYNQGATSACVTYSTCGVLSAFEQAEKNRWLTFDAAGLYRQMGGTGGNGVPTRETLAYCQDNGAWLLDEPARRFRLKSYAFVSMRSRSDIEIVKSAVASGRPVVLALLPPVDFSGWSTGAQVSGVDRYHQVIVAKYDADRPYGPNSWGYGWGGGNGLPAGWWSVPWEFLFRSEQQGLVYAYTLEDAPNEGTDPTPVPVLVALTGPATAKAGQVVAIEATLSVKAPVGGALVTISGFQGLSALTVPAGQTVGVASATVPQAPPGTRLVLTGSYGGGTVVHQIIVEGSTPPPVTRVRVAGKINGPGAGQLAVGQRLGVSGTGFAGTLDLTQITPDEGPAPDTLKVTGYSVNPVRAGASFDVYGTGFVSGNIGVTWGSQTLPAERISGTAIATIAPASVGSNPVQVRVEGGTAVGPILTVETGTEPVGDVAVRIEYQRRLGRNVWVYASATEGGQPVATSMNLFVDGAPVQNGVRPNVPAGSQGMWGYRQQMEKPAVFKVIAKSTVTGKEGSVLITL